MLAPHSTVYRRQHRQRRGAAALDHVLALAVTLPILTIVIPVGQRMIRAVWELTCVQVAWPFL
jgi:hypothetical protein